ncbi:MAG: DNA polymerase III subunit beta [Candidatus Levyibacteriota bacterium]
MKLSILAENLQKKSPFIARAVSIRTQLPILSNILLLTKKGKLQISSTDLEIGIQVEIPANIEEEGGITVPAKSFLDLINSLPLGKLILESDGEALKVLTTKTKSTFQTISKDEFPKLYEEKGEKIFDIQKKSLQKDFSMIIFSAAQDSSRPALSGVLLKKDNKTLTLVATDGFRLSYKKVNFIQVKKREDLELEKPILVPARVFREIISLKDEEGEVEIYISKKNNQILFEQEGIILVGRLIEADYPNYEKIIPANFTTSVIFDKEELQKAVKICSIFARETANIIKISLKKDLMIVCANTQSIGDNKVEVEAKLNGEENEIAFNARYLLDLLGNIEEEEMVFEMTGPLNPGVFKIKEDPTFLHLIMPIRVQE